MSSSSAQLRKIKKPLIERRRRERINDSLNQLKNLVLEATHKDETRYSKMEKADILEMTVAFLRATHCRRRSGLGVTSLGGGGGVDRYAAGFRECAVHVGQYLLDAGVNFGAVHERLMSHLETALQTVVDVDDCGRLSGGDAATRWSGDCDTTGRCSPDDDDDDNESRSVSGTVPDVVDDVVRWQYTETELSAGVQLLTTNTATCRQPLQPGSDADSPRSADEFPSFPPSSSTSADHTSSLPCDVINDAIVVKYDVMSRVTSSDISADDVWRPW